MNVFVKVLSTCVVWFAAAVLPLSSVTDALAADTFTYYHNDLLGSPAAATDSTGAVIWQETYSGYGERVKNQPASAPNKVWYTSRHQDEDTGLVYMGARYYDPAIGRFLSVDSVGFNEGNLQSFNRYAYANNNPYKFTDPDGRNPIAVAFAIDRVGGMVVGGIIAGAVNAGAQQWMNGSVNWGGVGGVGDAMSDGAMFGLITGLGLSAEVGAVRGVAGVRSSQVVVKFGEKIEGQLERRGWTKDDVIDTVRTGAQRAARDERNVGNLGRRDEPATRYTRPDGQHVVINNQTGDVVQVSDMKKTDFIPHGGN